MKQKFEKIKLFPSWARVLLCALAVGVLVFCVVWAAYNKDFDKAVTLAALLVAIISTPFFSVRAEMEKHLFFLSAEKKYTAYESLFGLMKKCLFWLGHAEEVKVPQAKQVFTAKYAEATQKFLDSYMEHVLFLSEETDAVLQNLAIEIYANKDRKKIKSLIAQAKEIMRKELGL